MKCSKCGNYIREHERHCPVCNTDAGYPNVRAAEMVAERTELSARLAEAEHACAADGRADVLTGFRNLVSGSKAVLCRPLSQALKLLSTDNELYASFYGEVDAGTRRPEESLIENDRLIADDLLFPHYREHIRFAALSLDGNGVREYGSCSMVLSELAIGHRATVFEKNSVEFCRDFKLGVGSPVPRGHRAVWEERDKLAAAKLHSGLQTTDVKTNFSRRLLRDIPGFPPDFIEVHVYGALQRRAIEQLVVPNKVTPGEEAIIIEIERRAAEIGAGVIRRDS